MSDPSAADEQPASLRVSDFDYELPPALIAQTPLADRTSSRLLVVDRGIGVAGESLLRDLGDWINPGDLLVGNNSRVIPARLFGVRADTGSKVEFLLLERQSPGHWTALARPARRLRPGTEIALTPRATALQARDGQVADSQLAPTQAIEPPVATEPAVTAIVREQLGEGLVRLELPLAVDANLAAYGALPLPPYVTARLADDSRYQTVYAQVLGSAAAPTAGLHFTPELIANLRARGIGWAEVTLHVGLDTFRPVAVEHVADHKMHSERWSAPAATLTAIQATRARGNRVVAIGTTTARTLETIGLEWDWRHDTPRDVQGATSIFIFPGYQWQLVDALLTNFHLPRSTLLMMVSSIAGRAVIEQAYAYAIAAQYRFFSFGDAMLIRSR